MIRSHVASPLRLQLWAFEACGPLNFLSTQWPGACSIELIPNINAAATNNKAACKSWKIYNLKAGNYFFFSSLKVLFVPCKQFPSKITTTSRGLSSSYHIFELLYYSSFLFASPFTPSPPSISRIIKFTEWKPFKASKLLLKVNRRWKSSTMLCLPFGIPHVPCSVFHSSRCHLKKLHSLKNRGSNRKERERRGWTLLLLLMFDYKKNWKRFPSLTAITAI